jgi:F-type H+-transporting ATPase subunit delta
MSGVLARRYTQGLFDYANEHGLVDAVDAGLQVVAQAMQQTPEFLALIEHPVVSSADKARMITEVFGAAVDPIVIRFIKIVLERGRGAYLIEISSAFHTQAEAVKGLISVRVQTAFAFSDSQVEQLQQQLSTALNKQARAVVEVKPELIAGYRIQVGNRVMDATVRGALEQFENKLQNHGAIEEGTH